ncbi:MAG: hypothetical protein WCJ30_00785, partial [Deltaproteobacteria bacterium]
MNRMRAVMVLALGLAAWSAGETSARAQSLTMDAGAIPSSLALPAPLADAGVSTDDANLAAATPVGSCPTDPIPAGHEAHTAFAVSPLRPVVGDRVIITYRLFHRASDGIEFDPDPVVFSQPDAE